MFERKPNYQAGLTRFADRFGPRYELSDAVRVCREYLSTTFGVENLTTIEGVRLRWCVEQALEAFDLEFQRESGGEVLNVGKEAAYRWIISTYDIDVRTLDFQFSRAGGISEEFKEWLSRERVQSHLL